MVFTSGQDAGFSYSISNDERSLTVVVKVQDPAEALKLSRNGMDVWIDPKGKKNKKIGVHYPLAPSADEAGRRQQGGGGAGGTGGGGTGGGDWNPGDTGVAFMRKQVLLSLARNKTAEYTGFKPEINGKKDVSDTGVVAITTDYPARDAFYCSVRIPLSAFVEPIDPHHPFSVGIIIKGMQMGNGGGMGGPPGDDGGGFGGGGPPPGGGGGPGGPDGDDFRKMFADDAVWQKVSLK